MRTLLSKEPGGVGSGLFTEDGNDLGFWRLSAALLLAAFTASCGGGAECLRRKLDRARHASPVDFRLRLEPGCRQGGPGSVSVWRAASPGDAELPSRAGRGGTDVPGTKGRVNERSRSSRRASSMLISNSLLLIFAVAFMGCVLATPVVTRIAVWAGAIDRPDQFRPDFMLGRATPRLGGLGLAFGLGGRGGAGRPGRLFRHLGGVRRLVGAAMVGARGLADRALDRLRR